MRGPGEGDHSFPLWIMAFAYAAHALEERMLTGGAAVMAYPLVLIRLSAGSAA